ncbi:hypothetical protein SEUCBS140593_009907 [Sporothrix eucalyptigena]|uniref:Zn(2)-C6 fungal-type domain-containing protein n=1 Tax=Sporothrix eucalyptigena TaxID=1812306 RepID=A0ABP0D0J4_9PEZI
MPTQTATPAHSPPQQQAAASQPPQPSKRCSMACTTCRQVKLRCDAAQRYPSPCSRCEKRRRTCVFDAEFKRRPVRGALEKLLEEKEQLQQMLSQAQEPTVTPSHSEASVDEPGYDLDGVRLSFTVVEELFQFYIAVFLPLLPILDIAKPPSAVCADSELLFWTVIITAAQNHPVHRRLYFEPLVPAYRRLLADALVRPARTVYMTQSLLIVSAWPLSVDMQRDDPSWYYCGFAASSAIHLRLHEAEALWWYSSAGGREEVVAGGGAESASEDQKDRTSAARYKTWLGAFVVSNTMALDMGLPPPMGAVTPLATNVQKQLAAVTSESLPETFVARLELQTVLFRSYTVLKDAAVASMASLQSTAAGFSARNPLLDVLERELDAFEQKWSSSSEGKVPFLIKMDLLAARLRLRAPLLMPLSSPGPNSGGINLESDVFVEAAWQKTVHYAGQIVQLMTDFLLEGSTFEEVDGPEGSRSRRRVIAAEKRCLPKHYYRILLMAVFALLIYVMLHPRGRQGENATARDDVFECARAYARQAPDLIQGLARHPSDEHGRCARFLGLVAHYLDDEALADEFARALEASPVTDIIEVGIKASWAIRQRLRRKYLEGPDRDLPRSQPEASTPAASTGRRTIVTRSAQQNTIAPTVYPLPSTQETAMFDPMHTQQQHIQLQQQMTLSFGEVDQPMHDMQPEGGLPGQQLAQTGFSDELFTDWNAWFDDADDFMNLFRAPTWNPM